MDVASGERDDGGHSRDRGGAERPVGHAQGGPRQQPRPAAGKNDAAANPLVKALVADFETSVGRTTARDGLQAKLKGSKPEDMKARCIETLQQARTVVETKAPDDASAFAAWLYQISQRVAEAAKEGGFLGFGGVAVSEAEKATLSEISAALKIA
jgi:hypothetical protein